MIEMNKGDISRIIKMFAEYCNRDLEFGETCKIDNTGKRLDFTIKIHNDKSNKVLEYYNEFEKEWQESCFGNKRNIEGINFLFKSDRYSYYSNSAFLYRIKNE